MTKLGMLQDKPMLFLSPTSKVLRSFFNKATTVFGKKEDPIFSPKAGLNFTTSEVHEGLLLRRNKTMYIR